jgi:hypothetical protein
MKNRLGKIFLILFVAFCGAWLSWAGDGQIDIAILPFTISSSGSYVVVKDLSLSTQNTNGITISAYNVTIDLNGHTLIGPGKTMGTSGSGINVGSYFNITVRNGTIRDWRGDGIGGSANNSLFELLRCYNNGNNGINTGSYSTVKLCNCSYNGSNGIVGSVGVISENSCSQNGADGISGGGSSGTINGNTCTGNDVNGIHNYGGVVTNNNCAGNTGDGILAEGGLINGNYCAGNTGNGIRAWTYCRVTNNTCYSNGAGAATASGIKSIGYNSIENNLVTSNDTGIDAASGDFLVGNRARNNTTDYSFPSNCLRGQVINGTAGGQISTTDPYANFRF